MYRSKAAKGRQDILTRRQMPFSVARSLRNRDPWVRLRFTSRMGQFRPSTRMVKIHILQRGNNHKARSTRTSPYVLQARSGFWPLLWSSFLVKNRPNSLRNKVLATDARRRAQPCAKSLTGRMTREVGGFAR